MAFPSFGMSTTSFELSKAARIEKYCQEVTSLHSFSLGFLKILILQVIK